TRYKFGRLVCGRVLVMTEVPGPFWSPLRLRSSSAMRGGHFAVSSFGGIFASIVQACSSGRSPPGAGRPNPSMLPERYHNYRVAAVPDRAGCTHRRTGWDSHLLVPGAPALLPRQEDHPATAEIVAIDPFAQIIFGGLWASEGVGLGRLWTSEECGHPACTGLEINQRLGYWLRALGW